MEDTCSGVNRKTKKRRKMSILLSVGKTYPLPHHNNEGACANFLLKEGNVLQIILPGMDDNELYALKKGKIKAGLLYEAGSILWLFQFFDKKGEKLMTFDSPFNARSISKDKLALHDINNSEQRLTIEIHVIDEFNVLRVIRGVTMSNKLTVNFLSYAQEQLSIPENPSILDNWMNYPPDTLTGLCDMELLGV